MQTEKQHDEANFSSTPDSCGPRLSMTFALKDKCTFNLAIIFVDSSAVLATGEVLGENGVVGAVELPSEDILLVFAGMYVQRWMLLTSYIMK